MHDDNGSGSGSGNGRNKGNGKSGDRAHDGRSKIERYKWRTGTKRGVYMDIPKSDLLVDDSYQRRPDEWKIKRIASEWSWPAIGALIVAMRDDGKFYVVDGQHRALAAMRRADVETMPCIVFEMSDMMTEAQAFLDANTARKPLSALNKFNALLATGSKGAEMVVALAQQANRQIGDSTPTGIRCVGLLLKMANEDGPRLQRIWPLITDLCHGMPISETIVGGLYYVEGNATESVMSTRWRSRIAAIGATKLLEGAAAAVAFYKKGGDKVWAAGMVNVINRGLKNRLEMRTSLDGRPETNGKAALFHERAETAQN